MSFTFEWPRFSDQFHADAIQMLNNALNKGNKPPVIADKIEVVELEMGTQPPELEIRDIGDLTVDQFRGIFRLTYSGDAHIVLKTKVQANPLNHKQPDIHLLTGSRGMMSAQQPLVVPMLLRLSHFKLNSYVVLVVSKQKGITLVFKTDPLQNVDINSTFDSIAVIQKFIQREIEGQLRQMFREDLPGIIHRLSQQWVKAKVEAPYLSKRPASDPPSLPQQSFDTSTADTSMSQQSVHHVPDAGLLPYLQSPVHTFGYRRTRSVSSLSVASSRPTMRSNRTTSAPPPTAEPVTTSFPDLENYDLTYGLRPEGLPAKSVFSSFGRLFTQNRGLADLAEEEEFGGDEDGDSFGVVDWEDSAPDITPPTTVSDGLSGQRDDFTEYETIPAVGGGRITRPRVYHSQSMIKAPSDISETSTSRPILSRVPSMPLPGNLLSARSQQSFPGHPSWRPSSYFSDSAPHYDRMPIGMLDGLASRTRSELNFDRVTTTSLSPPRPVTPDSLETQLSQSSSGMTPSVSTPPASDLYPESGSIYIKRSYSPSGRRMSISSNLDSIHPSSPSQHNFLEPDPQIVLRPSLNNTIHQLSTLSHSNHTLSPFTRSLEHFTVRSVPPRAPGAVSSLEERQPVRARRKRTYRLGAKSVPQKPMIGDHIPQKPPSPSVTPPSEFDEEDMDQYFRSRDDLLPHATSAPHSTYNLRHRTSHSGPTF